MLNVVDKFTPYSGTLPRSLQAGDVITVKGVFPHNATGGAVNLKRSNQTPLHFKVLFNDNYVILNSNLGSWGLRITRYIPFIRGTDFTMTIRVTSEVFKRFLCFVFDNGSGAMSTLPIDVGGEGISLSDMKVDITITPKTTTAKVSILPGDKQDGVPSPRTGHTLVAISSLQAILFGGLELASRHARLGTCAQSCKDGYFYLLDMTTLRWNKLPLPPLVPRAYDYSTWVPASSTMVIVGGITYSGHCPSERLSVSDVVCLKVSDTSQYTLTEIHMEGRELLQTLNQRDAQ
ncbi:Galectin [Branchiostoma belcheri]|nr:Galectin [Branchiostoma belcheri]